MDKKTRIPLIILLVIAGMFLLGRFGFNLGSREYRSYEEFRRNAYLRLTVDIPEGATDQRFFSNNSGIGKYSLYAFTLDKEGYDKFIRSMVVKYNLECSPEDDNAKYGYAQYYMKKPGDVQYPGSEGDSFPLNLKYDKVIDDNIRSYSIILFNPMYSGTSSSALVANPVTGRIVVMNKGNIR